MKIFLIQTFQFIRYLTQFGYRGVLFLLKTKMKNKNEIVFVHPKYYKPIILRNNTSDISVFNQVIFNQDYNIPLNFIPKIIIDCGANIGLTTIYFKNKFPDAKIISVEPEKSNYEILQRNTKNDKDIFCLRRGIWNKTANLIIKNSDK